MNWILILYFIGSVGGSSYHAGGATSVEFNTKSACYEAKQIIKSKQKYHNKVLAVCVPKGEKE